MGSMVFERIQGAEVTERVSFDSSPAYSLVKRYGWHAPSFKLKETDRTPNLVTFDVLAAQDESGRAVRMGVLKAKTRDAIRAELSGRTH